MKGLITLHPRLGREKKTISAMIGLYCRDQHKARKKNERGMCVTCCQLESYAHSRIHQCRHGMEKPTCGQCTTPCYNPRMREEIKRVMGLVRVKMVYHHPVLTYYHMKDFVRAKTKKGSATRAQWRNENDADH